MIFNLIHRPQMSETYDFQRKCAHDLKLKATIMIPTKSLENTAIIKQAMEDHERYGDEIGIWISPMKSQPNTQVWLLSEADKRVTVKYSIDKYKEIFGYAPKSVGNYLMDSQIISIIKEYCPEVTAVVAGCFEEGVKVFHGCNNSWYLFSEGMTWNPWYPSKTHSARPAKDENDWAGVVAVPHLSRDLVLGYEGRNDFFASHPANIQRGLANDGYIHEYDFNLADQYRMQEDYNNGFSYYQIHVGPGWLHGNPNIIDNDEITQTLYRETLEYMAKLKEEGELNDMYLSEFAEYYKNNIPINHSDIGVGKDILFGSGKQYFWLYNKSYRILIDTFQGGSIGDLRPYIGQYASFTGVDSDNLTMNSYPYIIQSQYRSGAKNHHEDGSRTTLLVRHNGEELDMCNYPTRIENVVRMGNSAELTLTPAELIFKDGFTVKIQTVLGFEDNGTVNITRKIVSVSDTTAELEIEEYVKGCYGFTEYPENMKNIELFAGDEKIFDYAYSGTESVSNNENRVSVKIPQINTIAELTAVTNSESVSVADGHLFSPFYTMKLKYNITENIKEVKSCLKLKRTTV